MRLPLIPPADLDYAQRAMYDEIADLAAGPLQGFQTRRASDDAFAGPFNAYLHFPTFGRPFWDFNKALVVEGRLPATVREVAILTTGARFTARYEIYAHEGVAEQVGLKRSQIATITAGQRPEGLTVEEAAGYDVTSALVDGKQVGTVLYDHAVELFGRDGVAELFYLVGNYCAVSVLLNGFDESVPGAEHGLT